jgi:hypothetical protein
VALTGTEAHAVNRLLDWVLGLPNALGEPVASDQAAAAAALLADHAYKTLSAGLTGDGVMSHWPDDDEPAGMPVETITVAGDRL